MKLHFAGRAARPGAAARLLLACLAMGAGLSSGPTAFGGNYFQGVSPANLPWPNGVVPYVFDTNDAINPAQKNVILAGLREWELAANVHFVPYTNQPNHVLLQFTNDGSGTGYYLSGSPATLMLHGLARGLICHEGGHLLGLQHEHQRTDRTNYIVVNFANVLGGTNGEGAFVIDTNSTSFGPYDLVSVMHYGPDTFANGSGDALDPLPAYQDFYHKLGNLALSSGDRAAIANLYGAPLPPLGSVVTNTADGGAGSLRAAIYYANDHPGTTIRFNLPVGDPDYHNGSYTISLLGELPPLTSAGTILNGTTQPGFTNHPVIVLDGSQVPTEAGQVSGLHLYGTNTTVRSLALGNFSYAGIQLFCSGATSNHVEDCYLGLAPDGTNAAPNFLAGIIFQFGAHDNVIGGLNPTQSNLISGNTEYGVIINDTNSDRNGIVGNFIGLDATGAAKLGNGFSGVGIWNDAAGTLIGGTNAGARNVISGNGQYGVFLAGTNVSATTIQGNFIGTDASGSNSVPNGDAVTNSYAGIGIFSGAHDNLVGGTNALARNIISGNTNAGVYLANPGVTGNLVQGNYIGLNMAGTTSLTRQQFGIYLLDGASGNTIGGTVPGARNVIAGNQQYGLYISDPGTTTNFVLGNYIGPDFTGTSAVGNGGFGIGILNGASGNCIGGSSAGAGNLISGNPGFSYGVAIIGATDNTVEGNLIGTDYTGENPLGNGFAGVGVYAGSTGNLIGGISAGAGNIIAANASYNVLIADPGTGGNLVQGNWLGTDSSGSNSPGYSFAIVTIQNGATNNSIGGPGAGMGNVIAFAGTAGVAVYDPGTTNNSIRGNSIFGDGGLGIDLNNDGVTPNDPGDADAGPNNLQNFPVITNAFGEAGSTVVLGQLNSTANRSFFIDVYRNAVTNSSGYGEGRFYAGSVSVSTDGSGNAAFAFTNLAANESGQYFTATATSLAGDTSEFSADMLASNLPLPSARFSAPTAWRTNGFVFNLTFQTNFTYRLQAATNLAANPVAWLDLTNFTATQLALTFTDSAATGFHTRFYRVISP